MKQQYLESYPFRGKAIAISSMRKGARKFRKMAILKASISFSTKPLKISISYTNLIRIKADLSNEINSNVFRSSFYFSPSLSLTL